MSQDAQAAVVRVLVIEDKFSHAHVTMERILEARGPSGRRAQVAAVMDHTRALVEAARVRPDVALIDAMRHPHDLRDDPGALGFAGLAIAQALHDGVPGCRVIGYSSVAHRPAINIAFRDVPNVVALYDQAALIEHLPEVLWSEHLEHQVPPPGAEDFAALGLQPGARLWAALQFVMARDDTWEAVARVRGYQGIESRTREHLNKYLPDLMPMSHASTYRSYVELLRAVAGFA